MSNVHNYSDFDPTQLATELAFALNNLEQTYRLMSIELATKIMEGKPPEGAVLDAVVPVADAHEYAATVYSMIADEVHIARNAAYSVAAVLLNKKEAAEADNVPDDTRLSDKHYRIDDSFYDTFYDNEFIKEIAPEPENTDDTFTEQEKRQKAAFDAWFTKGERRNR